MDNISKPSISSNTELFSNKNSLIIVLLGLLVLSILGINLLTMADNVLKLLYAIIQPLISVIFTGTGILINKSTDIITDTTKTGIDIAGGTFHSVGDLLKKAGENSGSRLDTSINVSTIKKEEPKPDTTENPIQKPIVTAKTNWCLVGEYKGRRGCIEISEHDKCLSGQVFPYQKTCLNPTFTNNMNNLPKK
jgi:hypothetical protein